jgi:two-component sensor histidine kinase
MKIQDSNDLLSYLITQASERKDWFGFTQQRLTAISLAHEIARNHADKLSPEEAVDYAKALNEAIYQKIIRAGN